MHIVVCIKQVPDPQAPTGSFHVDETSGKPAWSPPAENVISTFDLHAVEAAARLREDQGARVTLVSVGPPEVEPALRRALAVGADAAIRIEIDDALGDDRLGVARVLAAAARKLSPVDLILCGRIAADWDAGHVPMMLAELLGFAGATPVLALECHEGEFVVERLTDIGRETIAVPAPCVLAVSNELNEPGYPTMRAVLAAQRVPLTVWSAEAIGLEGPFEPRVRLQQVYIREPAGACDFVEGDSPEAAGEALAGMLHEAFGQ